MAAVVVRNLRFTALTTLRNGQGWFTSAQSGLRLPRLYDATSGGTLIYEDGIRTEPRGFVLNGIYASDNVAGGILSGGTVPSGYEATFSARFDSPVDTPLPAAQRLEFQYDAVVPLDFPEGQSVRVQALDAGLNVVGEVVIAARSANVDEYISMALSDSGAPPPPPPPPPPAPPPAPAPGFWTSFIKTREI